jgi:ribosomal protein S18 acetylase RimI-like enzyme
MTDKFEIISGHNRTSPFLDDVQKAADEHRNSLGFFARSVYEEFARRDHLYVLVEKTSDGLQYAGHLLFERRFPRAKVVQMFTLEKYRRRGLATKLIRHLLTSLTQDGFTSIYARVAEDLIDANAYWHHQQFYVQRIEAGGVSRNRKILVRCHELASPQLFPSSGINADNPLGLATTSSNVIPLYLLDLNVLFDLSPRRLRHDEATSLFQAERMNFCRLAISNEIREELKRTALHGKTDPMETFINVFPSFPLFQNNKSETLIEDLASIIFPEKSQESQLSPNDKSDLRHVATVIQCKLAGLITNDEAVLKAAQKIEVKYGVEVISPSAFKLDDSVPRSNNNFETAEEATLTLLDVSRTDESAIHSLLSNLGLSGSTISSGWLPSEQHGRIASRYAVWNSTTLIGYLTWSARDNTGSVGARVAVDETNPQALSAARILLLYLLDQLSPNGPYLVRLELPHHQSYLRELASGFGFSRSNEQHVLSKIILGGVLTSETWNAYQDKLSKKSKLKLPSSIPTYRSDNQLLPILTPDGNQTHVALDALETLLSPALFCLPGRPAVITPIQRSFSEPLLGHSKQSTLLPLRSASLFQERHYVSGQQTLQHFKRGTLILFYESTKQKGRCEIVAIARVRQAFLKPYETFDDSDLTQSVLTATTLTSIGKSKMRTVTVFDNIYPLPNPVPLTTLQRIGCGKSTDLITTHPINDAQLQEILREAFKS